MKTLLILAGVVGVGWYLYRQAYPTMPTKSAAQLAAEARARMAAFANVSASSEAGGEF